MAVKRIRKYKIRNTHSKNYSTLAGLLFFFCLILIGLLHLRLRNGTHVQAPQDKNILPDTEIVCYRQDDARWSDDTLGSSSYTMGSSGCLISCIASALSMEHGIEETPGALNGRFSSNQIYDAEGNLLWGRLAQLNDYQTDVFPEVTSEIIDTCLTEDRYPIVRIRRHILGSFHYILIIGSKDGEYLCMDPLENDITKLSTYGNRVYAIRCVSAQDP